MTKEQLDPYYARAHQVCELGPYDYDPTHWNSSAAMPLPLRSDRLQTALSQYSPPTRFGHVYRDEIRRARTSGSFCSATWSRSRPRPTHGKYTCCERPA